MYLKEPQRGWNINSTLHFLTDGVCFLLVLREKELNTAKVKPGCFYTFVAEKEVMRSHLETQLSSHWLLDSSPWRWRYRKGHEVINRVHPLCSRNLITTFSVCSCWAMLLCVTGQTDQSASLFRLRLSWGKYITTWNSLWNKNKC